jgi:arsenate reductase-like glutaredoxin family protein
VPKPLFIWKKTCSTCRQARSFVHEQLSAPTAIDERELNAAPLSENELDALIGRRDYLTFLNTRNELYRERKMKQNPPTRAEALKLMAAQPNLIRRPLLIRGDEIVYGFDEQAFARTLKGL